MDCGYNWSFSVWEFYLASVQLLCNNLFKTAYNLFLSNLEHSKLNVSKAEGNNHYLKHGLIGNATPGRTLYSNVDFKLYFVIATRTGYTLRY